MVMNDLSTLPTLSTVKMKKLIYVAAVPTVLVGLSVIFATLNVVDHIPLMKEAFELIGFCVFIQFIWKNKEAEVRNQTVETIKETVNTIVTDEEVVTIVTQVKMWVDMLKNYYTIKFNSDDKMIITSGPYRNQQEAEREVKEDELAVHLTPEVVQAEKNK